MQTVLAELLRTTSAGLEKNITLLGYFYAEQ